MAITWTDNVTPLNAVNMNLLEQASNKNVANGYPTLDASTNLALAAAQKIIWAGDTSLYRSAAGTLKTDGELFAVAGLRSSGWVMANNGSVANQFYLAADGKFYFGSAADTDLYRFAASFLGTTSDFVARQGNLGQVSLQSVSSVPTIFFGSAQDTSLQRSAAATLKVNGTFRAGQDLYAQDGTAQQIRIGNNSGSATIDFGSALDTRIYRSAAGFLKTDGGLRVASSVQVNQGVGQDILIGGNPAGGLWRGISFINDAGSAWDTNLYRALPDVLKTDDNFWVGTHIALTADAGKLYFGVASDVNLSRHAAGYLRTGGSFVVDNELYVDYAQAGNKLLFGAGDVNLYRSSGTGAGITLATDGGFYCAGITCRPGVTGTTPGSRFIFNWTGTSYDAYVDNVFIVSIYSSDGRNKKSIKKLPSTWETVKRLRPVSFSYRNRGVFKDDGRTHVGFLAQDVQAELPEGVSVGPLNEAGEEPVSLNLNAIVAALTKALQEAMTRIEKLEGKVEAKPA